MYDVSDAYLETLKSGKRIFPTRCKVDGITEYITNISEHGYIRMGTFTDMIDGNNILSMGNACANKIEMSIYDLRQAYAWKGARFTFEKGLKVNGATEWVPWGTFWVTDMETPNHGKTVTLTAYDYMYKLSKTTYKTELKSPFHYCDLLNEFLTLTGLTLSTELKMPSANDAVYGGIKWPEGTYSYADIAGHLAGMVGANARISKSDPTVIEFVWYKGSETATKIHKDLHQDGFEKLADGFLRIDYLVTGSNNEIVIENDGSTEGELDFRQFDSENPDDFPWLIFGYDDTNLTATVQINPDYAADTLPLRLPSSLYYKKQIYDVTGIPTNGFLNVQATAIDEPSKLATVGERAFEGCTNLKKLKFPETVTSLGWFVTKNCTSLEAVYYNAVSASIPSTGQSEQTVFSGPNLMSIILGEEVTKIPESFAAQNPALTFVNIPETVTRIEKWAFANCPMLTAMTIPESVTEIGDKVFGGDTALKTVYYNARASSRINLTEQSSTVLGGSGMEQLILGQGVNNIPERFCYNAQSLKELNMPNTITSIGELAFAYCTSLPELTIPENVTKLYQNISKGCTSLKTVYYNATNAAKSGTNVSGYSILNCASIERVIIGDKVKSLPQHLFRNCTGIKTIEIPSNVETIGSATFDGCTGLEEIIIHKADGSISGQRWGAPSTTTITWKG